MESSFVPNWLQAYDPFLVLGVGLVLAVLVLWLLFALVRGGGRKPAGSGLAIQSFQLAPLGRDAYLKVVNPGVPVTLSAVTILGRADVTVKNEVAGQLLGSDGAYSILLEASGAERLLPNFSVQFTFVDTQRQAFLQVFTLDPIKSVSFKHKRS
ncbi:MAG: hypothetical protein DA408_08970 [Bacteroidetes bacterium]|nr:MAG: hypothetical protein C7N36_20755 [Bacteroidota bacterium]PTM12846.1 MAG: hypothetical protein DA408_08970 [Bacteroidota bacterium]